MPEKNYPSRQSDQFTVRFPDGWRDVIKETARKERISMNSFLVNAIETAMRVKGVNLDTPST